MYNGDWQRYNVNQQGNPKPVPGFVPWIVKGDAFEGSGSPLLPGTSATCVMSYPLREFSSSTPDPTDWYTHSSGFEAIVYDPFELGCFLPGERVMSIYDPEVGTWIVNSEQYLTRWFKNDYVGADIPYGSGALCSFETSGKLKHVTTWKAAIEHTGPHTDNIPDQSRVLAMYCRGNTRIQHDGSGSNPGPEDSYWLAIDWECPPEAP